MIKISFKYIVLAIFVFGILIFIHELGHYLCARLCKVDIKEFAIGMGPKLIGFKSKKTDTNYTVRLLPLGGYVSMVGEDEESDSENAFNKKTVWQRILIVLAGPVMNLILGVIVMTVMISSFGNLYSTTVDYRDGDTVVSQDFGLCEGDKITKVGKVSVHTFNEVSYEIMRQGIEPLDITVIRNGEKTVIEGVVFPTVEAEGVLFGSVDFLPTVEEKTPFNVLKHSIYRSMSTVKMVVDSFVDLVRGRYGLNAMSGPVGITQTIGDYASMGLYYFLSIFVIITINLGVFNLFPIPALDGGRLLFLLIEAIIGRPLNPKIEGYIHFVGLVLMFGLVLVVTFNDILRLF